MKHELRIWFISSAPTFPLRESRSVRFVKPEMSTKTSDPSTCLYWESGVSRSQSIASRGTYGRRCAEASPRDGAWVTGAVAAELGDTGVGGGSTLGIRIAPWAVGVKLTGLGKRNVSER